MGLRCTLYARCGKHGRRSAPEFPKFCNLGTASPRTEKGNNGMPTDPEKIQSYGFFRNKKIDHALAIIKVTTCIINFSLLTLMKFPGMSRCVKNHRYPAVSSPWKHITLPHGGNSNIKTNMTTDTTITIP
jgi:hypothetical protein